MNRERTMQERKYFGYSRFGHIIRNYRAKEVVTLQSSDIFKVLMRRVIRVEIPSGSEVRKDKKNNFKKRKKKKKTRSEEKWER